MWLNRSVAIINATFQLLDIYIDIDLYNLTLFFNIYIYIYTHTQTLATLFFFINDKKISCILIRGGLESD